ncbi:MAG: hypothetical protein D6701_11545, partial [Gemmatimonadetes bacterium]
MALDLRVTALRLGGLSCLWALWLPGCLVNTTLYEDRKAALRDDDGDGRSEEQGDCDDADPDVAPGLVEVCDAKDNDCNGQVDDAPADTVVFYADGDGDGFGNAATALDSCSPPEGFVSEAGDCDDSDAGVSPEAAERCDGQDNDCDGDIDEVSAIDATAWYLDTDGDGYGDAATALTACAPPDDRYVAAAGDCDDEEDTTHPEAPELCDGLDNDCDGEADEAPTTGGGSYYRDADGDGHGDPIDSRCTPAEGYVSQGGDCDDSTDQVHPGRAEVCNDGLDNNCNGSADGCAWDPSIDMLAGLMLEGDELDVLGSGGLLADLDGDGEQEVVIGANNAPAPGSETRTGLVYGFRTPIDPGWSTDDADWVFSGGRGGFGEHSNAWGGMLAAVDLNADGYLDLVGSTEGADAGTLEAAGGAWLFLGPMSAGTRDSGDVDWIVEG